MASYYLESSALVKRYVVETGTAWIRGLCASTSGNTLFIAQVTGVEVVAAVALRAPIEVLHGGSSQQMSR